MKGKKWIFALITITIVIGIILFSSFAVNKYYKRLSSDLSEKISLLENNINNKNWRLALSEYKKIKTQWEDNKSNWAMLIDHLEIDNIDVSLIRLEKYIRASEHADALAETGVLKKYITHIPKKEEGSLANIL